MFRTTNLPCTARVLSVVFAVFILSCCFPYAGSAETILINGNNNKAPKIYTDNGAPAGILVDILQYVQKHTEAGFDIKLYPWARAYKNAVAGKGAIIGLSKTSERLKIFDYSEPVYYDEVIIVTKKGSEFAYTDFHDLKGKTVGIGRGGSFGDDFEKGKDQGVFTVSEDSGPGPRLKKLLAGRIDCALLSPGKFAFYQTVAQEKSLHGKEGEFSILDTPLKKDPNYLGFAKSMDKSAYLESFNAAIKKGYESGDIPKIIEQYEKKSAQ